MPAASAESNYLYLKKRPPRKPAMSIVFVATNQTFSARKLTPREAEMHDQPPSALPASVGARECSAELTPPFLPRTPNSKKEVGVSSAKFPLSDRKRSSTRQGWD